MTIREWYNNYKDRIENLNFSYSVYYLRDYTAQKKIKHGNFNMLNNSGDCNFLKVRFDIFKSQYINIHFLISPEEFRSKSI